MSGEYNIEPIDVADGPSPGRPADPVRPLRCGGRSGPDSGSPLWNSLKWSIVIVLSLDTTSRDGSAAVIEGGRIRFERAGDPRLTHGERLPGELNRVLEAAGVALSRVDLLAVAAGPGSFTGLRVGIAAMQGLAIALGRRIVPISTLEALSRAVPPDGARIATWMDAQRGQVFAALYGADGAVLEAPMVGTPAETLEAWGLGGSSAADVTFVGDGALRYAGVIQERLGSLAAVVGPPPLAGVIGLIAAAHPARAVNPHAVVPVYVRRPDAELARLREAGR